MSPYETLAFVNLCVRLQSRVGNDTKSTRLSNLPFKVFCERNVVQKDPWIVVMSIEPGLHLLHGGFGAINLFISHKHYKRSVGFSR